MIKTHALKFAIQASAFLKNDIQNIFKDFYRASNIKEKMIEGAGFGPFNC